MKKLMCLVFATILCISALTGCTPNNQELWDAYVKTSQMKSASTEMTLSMNFDVSAVKDTDMKTILPLLNGTKLDLNMKSIKDDNGIIKASASGNLTLMQTPYPFEFYVDVNLADTQNPKYVEIFKLPSNMPGMPSLLNSKYAYIDAVAMQEETGAPQIDFSNLKGLMDESKILDILKNIDTKEMVVDKKVVGSNKEFTVSLDGASAKSITNQYFNAILNGPIAQMYSGETSGQAKMAFNVISKALEQINLFGEEGIKSVITVNPDGYFTEQKDTVNLNIDLAQIAKAFGGTTAESMVPNEKFGITIESNTKYSDINSVSTIDLPQLTNKNSIDFASFSKLLSSEDTNVLLNGKVVDFQDVVPMSVNDRTMVPMRKIFESLGATVNYDNGVITAVKGDRTITHTIGENVIYVNGAPMEMDVPSFETDGRTLVPVRFISNALGANVDWNEELHTVIITSGE